MAFLFRGCLLRLARWALMGVAARAIGRIGRRGAGRTRRY